jgi:UDP-N-acetylmuramate dehydrogenase
MEIQEYVDIKNYSTFKIGGQFRYFVVISSIEELSQIYVIAREDVKYKNTPIFILGGGSNIVFSDGVINVVALKIEIKGFEIINETDEYLDIRVGAGENWDDFVKRSVEMNLSGVEAMSIIPGTVGAGPVQNVGAYGVEVKDIILNVEVFDKNINEFKILSNLDCKFGYRDSIFKNEEKDRYIITYVIYRLSKKEPRIPNYPDVLKYFADKNLLNPSLENIREAIIFIRNSKLPDFRRLPNVGSFFKNPIIENILADKLKENYLNIKIFPIDENYSKIPAGWLIENAELKGKSFGNISVYDKSALVLVNNNNASFDDLIYAKNEIIKIVFDKFKITLEQEPEIV